MIAAWIAVAFLWGAALALIGVTWYFRKTFLDLAERLTALECQRVEVVTSYIIAGEQDVLQKIADALESDDEWDDETTRTH